MILIGRDTHMYDATDSEIRSQELSNSGQTERIFRVFARHLTAIGKIHGIWGFSKGWGSLSDHADWTHDSLPQTSSEKRGGEMRARMSAAPSSTKARRIKHGNLKLKLYLATMDGYISMPHFPPSQSLVSSSKHRLN